MLIKTFFIDVGGVLVRTYDTSKRRDWEKKLGLKPRQLTHEIYKIEPAAAATVGLVTSEKIWLDIAEKFSLSKEKLMQLKNDFFDGDLLNLDFYNFLQKHHQIYKIALFTNAWDDARETNVQKFHLDKICDNMIISAEVGLRKPNKKMFEMALNIMNAKASESIFIDDTMENIKTGKDMGFNTILFKNTNDTISKINELISG